MNEQMAGNDPGIRVSSYCKKGSHSFCRGTVGKGRAVRNKLPCDCSCHCSTELNVTQIGSPDPGHGPQASTSKPLYLWLPEAVLEPSTVR